MGDKRAEFGVFLLTWSLYWMQYPTPRIREIRFVGHPVYLTVILAGRLISGAQDLMVAPIHCAEEAR
jgi:hypothetical protein